MKVVNGASPEAISNLKLYEVADVSVSVTRVFTVWSPIFDSLSYVQVLPSTLPFAWAGKPELSIP